MEDITDSLIFVVDDDTAITELVSVMIQAHLNVKVKTFNDESFLLDPDLKDIDLLIIDIVFPPGDKKGFELAYESTQIKFSPVLFVSGYGFDDTDEHNRTFLDKIDVYDFIQKPLLSNILINRVKLLLCTIKHTNCIIRNKEAIERRFWALLRNMVGIYCIFTDVNGNIVYSDYQFMKDIGLENEEYLHRINIHNILEGFTPVISEERQDFISQMHNLEGKVISIGKWFTWFINSYNNLFLTIGIPMVNDVESADSIYNYYKRIINADRAILDMLKQKH